MGGKGFLVQETEVGVDSSTRGMSAFCRPAPASGTGLS